MADEERDRAPEQADGDPGTRDALPDDWSAEAEDRRARRGDIEEPQDASAAEALSRRARGGYGSDVLPESAMGGTSDAGTAADDAAEAAAMGRGLPDDRTRDTPTTPGAGTTADKGTRGFSGGQTPPEDLSPTINLDRPADERFEEPGSGSR